MPHLLLQSTTPTSAELRTQESSSGHCMLKETQFFVVKSDVERYTQQFREEEEGTYDVGGGWEEG